MPSVKARAALYSRPSDDPTSGGLASTSTSTSTPAASSSFSSRRKPVPKPSISVVTSPAARTSPLPSAAESFTEGKEELYSEDDDEDGDDARARPPPVPVKPYPPKINEAIPPSPFAVSFSSSDLAGFASPAASSSSEGKREKDSETSRLLSAARGQSTTPTATAAAAAAARTGNAMKRRSSKIPVPSSKLTPSRSKDGLLTDSASRSGDDHDDDTARDSVYSNGSWTSSRHQSVVGMSAVVTTASAMSIKRAIASSRPMPSSTHSTSATAPAAVNASTVTRNAASILTAVPTAATTTTTTTSSTSANGTPLNNNRGRGPRVEKGTGVQARRKSRDKSSTRSSTTSSIIYPTVVLEERKRTASEASSSPPSSRLALHLPPPLPNSTHSSASPRPVKTERKGQRNQQERSSPSQKSSLDSNLAFSSASTSTLSTQPSSSALSTPQADHFLSPPDMTGGTTAVNAAIGVNSPTKLTTANEAERRPSLHHRRGKGSFASSIAVLDPLSDRWGSVTTPGLEKDDGALTSLDQAFATAAAKYGPLSFHLSPTSPANVSETSPHSQSFDSEHFKTDNSNSFDTVGGPSTKTTITVKRSTSSYTELLSDMNRPLPTKELFLTQLLASIAHVDAQVYEPLRSIEEVEQCKAEVKRLERKIVDLTHKLKVEMRVRDAADKVRRALSSTSSSSSSSKAAKSIYHARSMSSVSTASNVTHANAPGSASIAPPASFEEIQKAELDVVQARRKVDDVSKMLLEHKDQANVARRRLLQHEAKVLALRVTSLEEEVVDLGRALSERNSRDEETEEEDASTSSVMGSGGAARTGAKKVGHNLAVEEVEALRLKLQRAEESLAHERREREKEVEGWRKKHDDGLAKQRSEWTDKVKVERQEGERKRQRALEDASRERQELEEQMATMDAQIKNATAKMEEAGVSLATERAVMRDHQQLVEAFERKLIKTESKLRHEDERCAKMLGKTEGREEMDDLLAQIKAGYGNAPKKGDRGAAGKDIDSLLDSLALHISDMADEMAKGGGVFRQRRRIMRQEEGYFYDEEDEESAEENEKEETSQGKVRAIELELRATEQELERWRSEAESAKRQLTALQRSSSISATGSNFMGGGGGGGHLGSRDWRASRSVASSAAATAELEARIKLLEQRNANLEEELLQAKLAHTSPASSPTKVSGGDRQAREKDVIEQELATAKTALRSLMETLPDIPKDLTLSTLEDELDLTLLQRALERSEPKATNVSKLASRFGGPTKSTPETTTIDAQYGNQVVERAKNVLMAARLAVKRGTALQQLQASLEQEADEAQDRCENLDRAMEDLRNGHADQIQLVEAAKARERKLESTVSDLKAQLEKSKKMTDTPSTKASTKPPDGSTPMLTPAHSDHSISFGPSQTSSKTLSPLTQRRQANTGNSSAKSRSAGLTRAQPYKSSPTPFTEQYASLSGAEVSRSTSNASAFSPSASRSVPPTASSSAKDLPNLPGPEEQLMDSPSAQLRRLHLESEAALSPMPTVPRTITLGMDARQLIGRVRALEAMLVDVTKRSNVSSGAARINRLLQERLDESRAEMEQMQVEFEEIRDIDARQRVQLLEELSTLTSELSTARADLRAAQRKRG